jgi:phage/plasmid-like protein (TIGR03299 family)
MDQIRGAVQNAASDAERAARLRAQVAEQLGNGELRDLGNNRYEVLTGWDRGEVIRINRNRTALSAEEIESAITGDHGLDVKADGSVALYLKDEPAWHSFGTIIKGGSSSASTVLHAAGLDYTVLQEPATFAIPDGNGGHLLKPLAGQFVNYRDDTREPLGTVGSIYEPVQNVEAFNFLDALFGDHLMIAETAGSFREGRRVFISAEIPADLYVDPDGIRDHIRMFVMLINSHDGTTPFIAIVTPWRPVCKNTERLALRNAVTKWTVKHTKNAKNKIDEARRTLNLTNAYYEEFVKEEMALIQTPFGHDDVDALIEGVWGELDSDAHKRSVTMYQTRADKVHELFDMERARVGTNAYAAERAVTGYVDHFTNLRPRGVLKGNRLGALAQGIMEETLDEPKREAHKRLMTLVQR